MMEYLGWHSDQWLIDVQFGWILNVIYQIQTALVKVSVLLFYRRLAPSSYSQRFKFAVWIMIVAIAVQFLVAFILYLTQCIPLNAIWLSFDHNWASDNRYFCAPQSQFAATAWFAGVVGVITDVITALLPPWLFVQIRLPRRARIGLSIIFALGVLYVGSRTFTSNFSAAVTDTSTSITIPSVLRLVYLVQAAQPEADRTWLTMKALIAGKTEGDVAIICASIPSLHIFFRRFFHSGEPDRVSDGRPSSQGQTRHGNRSQHSLRRNPSRTSSRSARSVRFDQAAPEAGYDLKPHPHAPQVLKWSEKSLDDIPEAYADNVGTLTSAETDAESSVKAQDYGSKPLPSLPHQRPETAQSWLNIGPDSSDDEREGANPSDRGKAPKSYPKR